MELDELKESWNASLTDTQPLKTNIMEMIKNKSYGPLATLEGRFKWNFYLYPLVLLIFAWDFYTRPELVSSPLMWVLISLVTLIFFNFSYNYFIIKKIQQTGNTVKENMMDQIGKLERSFTLYNNFMRIYLVFVAVLFEVCMYYGAEPTLAEWYKIHIAIRILTYIAGIVFMHFVNRRHFEQQYGSHLKKLKELVAQLS